MQLVSNVEQLSAAQVFTKLLSLMNQNAQTLEDLFTENAVFESPYAARILRQLERLEGKAAICNLFKNVQTRMQDLKFSDIQVYPTTNPNLVWAEFHGEAVAVATGRPYQQDYVVRLETREGQIIHYCEYVNLMSAIEAWGSTQDLQQSFNAE
jgi:uncharacterized protein